MTGDRLHVVQASVDEPRAAAAVAELQRQLDVAGRTPAGIVVFCSPRYDLAELGPALARAFPCTVIGCTTAGQIGRHGFQDAGITAAALYSSELTMRAYLIDSLAQVQAQATQVAAAVVADRKLAPRPAFGLLLVDGLARVEERLAATLYESLGGIPIVGGSAGDDLAFERTHVYYDGRFHAGVAVLTLFESSLPFAPFKFQHFEPTQTRLVITSADPETRTVYGINGLPAAAAYAAAIGSTVEALTPDAFSRHPLLLKIGGDCFVRSIAKQHADQSLTFFCAIEEGLVLRIGERIDPVQTATRAFAEVSAAVGEPRLVIGCDCILRHLELRQDKLASVIGAVFSRHQVVGFSTYGEQWNGMHVNQTFTGVALGG